MPYGLYISAAGADAQSQRLQVLAHNLANVDTPGFKQELAVLQARHAEAIERGEAYAGSRSINDVGGGVRVKETVTDFGRGKLKFTGDPANLALEADDNFFVVEKDGQKFLTRAGNFQLSPEGRLMTQQGFEVQSEDGQPIVIAPGRPWQVLANGRVDQGGGEGATLAVVKPKSFGDLARVGENLFSALAPTDSVPLPNRKVASGFLELSSVSPTAEMMQLIEATRAYEANIRMIQHHDQAVGGLINRVLRA